MRYRLTLLTAGILAWLSTDALAQRTTAEHTYAKRTVAIEHGVPRFGSHNLEELPPGRTWRIGANAATTLETPLPLLSDLDLVPPGHYRIRLHRVNASGYALGVEGSGFLVYQRGDEVLFPATLEESKKKASKLALSWNESKESVATPGPATPRDPNKLDPVNLTIRFGPYQANVPMMLLAPESHKLKGWEVDSFAVPADVLEFRLTAGWHTPVATFRKKGKPSKGSPKFFNLLITEEEALLIPAQVAPGGLGFDAFDPPAEEWTFRSTPSWDQAQEEATYLTTTSLELNREKQVIMEIHYGRRIAHLELPQPLKARDTSQ